MDIVHGQELSLEQQLAVQPALIIPLSGETCLQQAEQITRMNKGCVYCCAAGTTFGITSVDHRSSEEHEQASVAILHYSFMEGISGCGRLHEVDCADFMPYDGIFVISSPDRLNLVCRSMYKDFHSKEPMKQWRVQLDFQELLYTMIAECSPYSKNDKRQALERVKEYIEEHYDEDLTIEQLANLSELSPKYFVEVYKKTYGHSAMDYLAHVRLNKAKQLMLGSDSLLREVAHMVGYKDEFYFSRKFKKAFGISPSVYMKTRKNKLAMYGSTALLGYAMPLDFTPYAAPLHPKWSQHYYNILGPDIPVHLDAYRQNHNKYANLEKLASARPELIVCAQGVEDWEKEQLRLIAPLYEMPEEQGGWQVNLLGLAKLLNKLPEAEQWIDTFHHKISTYRGKLPAEMMEERTLLTARLHQDELMAYSHPGMKELLFDYFNFQPAKSVDWEEAGRLTIEQIKESRADHMLLLIRQDSETLANWRKLQATPEWMTIPAVRDGTLHQLSSYPWREYSPIAMEQMAEEAFRLFSGNCP
ncbi:AraC family transcriptional regulator [Paenibacillus sp. FSL W7-1332]